jgi:hypothetical protein
MRSRYRTSFNTLRDIADEESLELVCERCGGYASRAVVLERVADKAGELGRLTLARLKLERSRRKRPDRT